MEDAAHRILDHFKSNTGDDYSDPIINNHVKIADEFLSLKENIFTQLNEQLLISKDDITKVNIKVRQSPNFKTDVAELVKSGLSGDVPALNAIVGGTQGVDVFIKNYKNDK